MTLLCSSRGRVLDLRDAGRNTGGNSSTPHQTGLMLSSYIWSLGLDLGVIPKYLILWVVLNWQSLVITSSHHQNSKSDRNCQFASQSLNSFFTWASEFVFNNSACQEKWYCPEQKVSAKFSCCFFFVTNAWLVHRRRKVKEASVLS